EGLQEQHTLRRQLRYAAAQGADQEAEDQQQQQQMQDAAQRVQAAPDTPEESAYRTHGAAGGSTLDLFFDAGGLARQIAQVVQLGAAHVAAALHLDVLDRGTVQLEHAFHALAVTDLAHGDRGVEAAVAARDDHAFIGLGTLAVAFLHLHVHHDGVAGAEL